MTFQPSLKFFEIFRTQHFLFVFNSEHMQYVNLVLQSITYFIGHESLTNHEQDICWICGNSQIGKNFF